MKILKFLFVSFLFLALNACTKDHVKYESIGWIGDVDASLCACCGGRFITIEDEISNGRFFFLPDGCNIDLDHPEDEAVKVKLNWKLLSDCNGIMHIEILDIAAVD